MVPFVGVDLYIDDRHSAPPIDCWHYRPHPGRRPELQLDGPYRNFMPPFLTLHAFPSVLVQFALEINTSRKGNVFITVPMRRSRQWAYFYL